MSTYKIYDFVCDACNRVWEDMVTAEDKSSSCSKCGKTSSTTLLSAPGIATFSLMSNEAQQQHLKKRSSDHTAKLKKQERAK